MTPVLRGHVVQVVGHLCRYFDPTHKPSNIRRCVKRVVDAVSPQEREVFDGLLADLTAALELGLPSEEEEGDLLDSLGDPLLSEPLEEQAEYAEIAGLHSPGRALLVAQMLFQQGRLRLHPTMICWMLPGPDLRVLDGEGPTRSGSRSREHLRLVS